MKQALGDSWLYSHTSPEVTNPELVPTLLLWMFDTLLEKSSDEDFEVFLQALNSPAFSPEYLCLTQHWFLQALPYPVLPLEFDEEGRIL